MDRGHQPESTPPLDTYAAESEAEESREPTGKPLDVYAAELAATCARWVKKAQGGGLSKPLSRGLFGTSGKGGARWVCILYQAVGVNLDAGVRSPVVNWCGMSWSPWFQWPKFVRAAQKRRIKLFLFCCFCSLKLV